MIVFYHYVIAIFAFIIITNIVATITLTDLSMNTLHAGNKSPVQRDFFTNSTGDLLPTLGFLGWLYNCCNFLIIFSLM